MLEVEGDPKVPADKKMVLVDGVFKTAAEFLEDYNANIIQKELEVERTEGKGDIADGVSWKEPKQLSPNGDQKVRCILFDHTHFLTCSVLIDVHIHVNK